MWKLPKCVQEEMKRNCQDVTQIGICINLSFAREWLANSGDSKGIVQDEISQSGCSMNQPTVVTQVNLA